MDRIAPEAKDITGLGGKRGLLGAESNLIVTAQVVLMDEFGTHTQPDKIWQDA